MKSRIQRLGCTDVINRLYCGSGDQHINSEHRKEESSPGYMQWRQLEEESGAAWCVKMFHLKIRNVSRSGIVFFRSREVRESKTMDSFSSESCLLSEARPKTYSHAPLICGSNTVCQTLSVLRTSIYTYLYLCIFIYIYNITHSDL